MYVVRESDRRDLQFRVRQMMVIVFRNSTRYITGQDQLSRRVYVAIGLKVARDVVRVGNDVVCLQIVGVHRVATETNRSKRLRNIVVTRILEVSDILLSLQRTHQEVHQPLRLRRISCQRAETVTLQCQLTVFAVDVLGRVNPDTV